MKTVVQYEPVGGPLVSVVRDGDTLFVAVADLDENGDVAALSISGLDPSRSPSEEEEAFGISSFNPPAGFTTKGELRLVDIAVRATQAAVESSGGLEPAGAIILALRVQHAVRGALDLMPADTSIPTGIGSVYVP